MANPLGGRRLEIWLPLVIVALDQATKAIVRAELPLHEGVTVIPGFLDFTHVRNTGAAFGILDMADFPGKTIDRKSTRLNSSHIQKSRMPSSA